tara:strand:+ start:18537 stop:18968 length:432 start_codon:yes stop_codon:yes gene_type:complete
MGYSSKQTSAREAVSKFEISRKAIHTFLEENPQFLDVFIPLMDEYNTLLVEAKNQIRELPGSDRISIGPFSRSARPKSVGYDATKINPEVLTIPGIVQKIDGKEIERLLVTGQISHADIQDGQREEYGSPRVNGPKEIVLKVV